MKRAYETPTSENDMSPSSAAMTCYSTLLYPAVADDVKQVLVEISVRWVSDDKRNQVSTSLHKLPRFLHSNAPGLPLVIWLTAPCDYDSVWKKAVRILGADCQFDNVSLNVHRVGSRYCAPSVCQGNATCIQGFW